MLSLSDYLARAAQALIAALVAIIRAIFGGAKEAAVGLVGDARRVGRAAKATIEATGRGVGRALEGPARALDLTASAVGSTLGALLPRPPVGPRDVADAAVARDNRGFRAVAAPAPTPLALVGQRVQLAAASLVRDGEVLHAYAQDLSPAVTAWLGRLTPAQLRTLASMPAWDVEAHVEAVDASGRSPLLPPVHAPVQRMAKEEMAAILSQARRNLAASGAEAAAMAKRGPHPRRDLDDSDDYAPPPRGPAPGPAPRFH